MVPIPTSKLKTPRATSRETHRRPGSPPDVQRFLQDLFLGMRCGVLSIDRTGGVTLINEPALHILELDESPPPGTPVERVLGDHPRLATILRESFGMSSLPNRAEMDLRFKGGKGKTLGFTLSLVSGPDGRPYGTAAFFKDLTQVEQKEEQERLKDRLAALGQMAASMAHEIRNPLASIEVTCSLLKRRISGQPAHAGLLDKIISEVRRLNGTISSSLEFVRPLSLTLAPADIVAVLEDAIRVAVGRCGAAGVEIVRNFDDALPPMLIDAVRIRQVFENLMVNALEAMGDRGRLTIDTSSVPAPEAVTVPWLPGELETDDRTQPTDAYLQVRVSDTGPGISEEHYDKLFYPFFTTKKSGSGVGLPMAEKIVTSHHGHIDVESSPGEGTVFTVRLPMVPAGSEG